MAPVKSPQAYVHHGAFANNGRAKHEQVAAPIRGIKPGGAGIFTSRNNAGTGNASVPTAPPTGKSAPATSGSQAGLAQSVAFKSLNVPDKRAVIDYLSKHPGAHNEVYGKFDAADCSVKGAVELKLWLDEIKSALLTKSRAITPREKIDSWVEANRDHLEGAKAGELTVYELKVLLKDGPLSKADQLDLIGRALPKQPANYYGMAAGSENPAEAVRNDPKLRAAVVKSQSLAEAARDEPVVRRVVAEHLFNQAVELAGSPGGALFAWNALKALADDDKALGSLLTHMPSGKAVAIVDALSKGGYPKAFDQVLRALNSVEPTKTTDAIVVAMSSKILPADLRTTPHLTQNLAIALARAWHSGTDEQTKALRARDEQRMFAILEDSGSAVFFLKGGSPAREAFHNSNLTVDDIKNTTGDPATNPAIANAMASAIINGFRDAGIKIPSPDNAVIRLSKTIQLGRAHLPFLNKKYSPQVQAQAMLIYALHPEFGPEIFKDGPWPGELQKIVAQTNSAANARRFPTLDLVSMPNMNAVANLVGAFSGKTPIAMNGMTPGEAVRSALARLVKQNVAGFYCSTKFLLRRSLR